MQSMVEGVSAIVIARSQRRRRNLVPRVHPARDCFASLAMTNGRAPPARVARYLPRFAEEEPLWPLQGLCSVVGSIILRISVILVAGKPLISACFRMMSSSLAR
jgi:hypothetical protein